MKPTTQSSQASKRIPPTAQEIGAEQKRLAEKDRQAAQAKIKAPLAPVPAKPNSTAVAVPDNRTPVERYLDETAPSGVVGRLIKFSKEANFITADDGEPIDEAAEFIALCDETLVGWIKFNGADAPPDRAQGLLYDGFVMPKRETLGDLDQSLWDSGLDGQPADPWQHQNCLVLQHTETRELFTFATTSATGRRAVGNLLRHYNRTRRTNPNELPVVKLKAAPRRAYRLG